MSSVITQIDIDLPEHLQTIEEHSFWRYLIWQDEKRDLSSRIIKKFRPIALAVTGYSDEKRPDSEVEKPLKAGELEFLITTKPTTKTPSYSQINEKFGNFLDHLMEQHQRGRLKRDYKTIEGEVYIALDVLRDKLEDERRNQLEGKEGIEQTISLVKPTKLITEVPDHLPIVLDKPYDALTEYNARMFVLARNMTSEGNRRTDGYTEKRDGEKVEVKRFKGLLLEDSLETIGDYPKNPVAVGYAFDKFTFVHQLEPRERTAYASVINAFMKEMPKKPTRKSTIGDFVKIEAMLQDESLKTKFMELGLVDEEFIRDYNPTRRGNTNYVRLQGIIDRLHKYRKDFASSFIEQNITVKLAKHYKT